MKETECVIEEAVEAPKNGSIGKTIGYGFAGLAGLVAGGAPTPDQIEFPNYINNHSEIVQTVDGSETNLKDIVDGDIKYRFKEESKTFQIDMTNNTSNMMFRCPSDLSQRIECGEVESMVEEPPSTYRLIYNCLIQPTLDVVSALGEQKKRENETKSLMEEMQSAEAKLDEKGEEIRPYIPDSEIDIDDEGTIQVDLAPKSDIEDITSILIDPNDNLDKDIADDSDGLNDDSDDDFEEDSDDDFNGDSE